MKIYDIINDKAYTFKVFNIRLDLISQFYHPRQFFLAKSEYPRHETKIHPPRSSSLTSPVSSFDTFTSHPLPT
jgi:hypothetical protein